MINPIHAIAGGDQLAHTLITMWLATTLGYMLRRLPGRVAKFIKQSWTVSVTLTAEADPRTNNRKVYRGFIEWFSTLPSSRYDTSREYYGNGTGTESVFGPSDGFHWFIYRNRLFWFTKTTEGNQTQQTQSGSSYALSVETVTISTYGRSIVPVEEIFELFTPDSKKKSVNIYGVSNYREAWTRIGEIDVESNKKLILDPAVEQQVFGAMGWFTNNQQWYRDRGLPYKQTIVLYGPTGTGKTSIIRLLAARYSRPCHLINLARSGNKIESLLADVKPGAIVAIEDFDDTESLHSRLNTESEEKRFSSKVPLSIMLNALDGICQLNDIVIVLTTNHIEKIDSAVIREGRVDHLIEVGPLANPEIHRFIGTMYPDYVGDMTIEYPSIAACKLHGLFLKHPKDPVGFIAQLNDYYHSLEVASNDAAQPVSV